MHDPNLIDLVHAFDEEKVKYVLIGGMALLVNGGGIVTSDIDLSIAFDRDNLESLARALNQFEPRSRNGIASKLDLHSFGGEFVTLFTTAGVVQIINRVQGFSRFSDLLAMSDNLPVNGTHIRVANLDALEIMKSNTGRDKDKPHLDIIRKLKEKRDA